MDFSQMIALTMFQLAVLIVLVWGWLIYDEKLARFERRTWRKLRRYAKVMFRAMMAR